MTNPFRHCLLAGLVLLSALGLPPVLAQTPSAAAGRPANRWLLVIETSRAMSPRAEAIMKSVGDLLRSGMNGQLQAGDSLGLWTYNNELHAGEFPLQTWSPEDSPAITERVGSFLARQKYENRLGRDQVFPALNTVISNSPFITVILVSSGSETFNGTPFDKAINAIHRRWESQQEKARLPFLTLLRAQRGRITDFEVNLPPAPLELPPLPPEFTHPMVVPKPMVEKPAVVVPPVVPSAEVVPNLIVHGKKPVPEIVAVVSNLPAAETKTNLPALVPLVSSVTNVTPMIPARTTNLATSLPATNPPAPQAASAVAAPGKKFWVAGVIGAMAMLGLGLVILRRGRSQSRVSLITRSLDRDQK